MKRLFSGKRRLLLLIPCLFIPGCAGKDPIDGHRAAYEAYQAQDYVLAAERFEQLVNDAPKDAELWFRLGNAHARAKNPKQAIVAYENALLRDPEMSKAWYNMGLVHLQSALKSFIDMESHVPADDPVGRRGREMREQVFQLLEGPADGGNED